MAHFREKYGLSPKKMPKGFGDEASPSKDIWTVSTSTPKSVAAPLRKRVVIVSSSEGESDEEQEKRLEEIHNEIIGKRKTKHGMKRCIESDELNNEDPSYMEDSLSLGLDFQKINSKNAKGTSKDFEVIPDTQPIQSPVKKSSRPAKKLKKSESVKGNRETIAPIVEDIKLEQNEKKRPLTRNGFIDPLSAAIAVNWDNLNSRVHPDEIAQANYAKYVSKNGCPLNYAMIAEEANFAPNEYCRNHMLLTSFIGQEMKKMEDRIFQKVVNALKSEKELRLDRSVILVPRKIKKKYVCTTPMGIVLDIKTIAEENGKEFKPTDDGYELVAQLAIPVAHKIKLLDQYHRVYTTPTTHPNAEYIPIKKEIVDFIVFASMEGSGFSEEESIEYEQRLYKHCKTVMYNQFDNSRSEYCKTHNKTMLKDMLDDVIELIPEEKEKRAKKEKRKELLKQLRETSS